LAPFRLRDSMEMFITVNLRVHEMKQIAFYTHCATCDGHGRVPSPPNGPRTALCPKCRGKGFLTTEEGQAIIDLVKVAKVEGLLPEAGV
jgi:DnaJ-class molecular chaperone